MTRQLMLLIASAGLASGHVLATQNSRSSITAPTGACVSLGGGHRALVGAVLGVIGGIVGCFGGYHARAWLVQSLRQPDFNIALLEDLIAIGGSLFIVSRF